MFNRYKNQYKAPDAGVFGKLMGSFNEPKDESTLKLDTEKPNYFLMDEGLNHSQAQPITETESRPISQPNTSDKGKTGWLSNAWGKTKDFFGAKVVGGDDTAPKVEEGTGHKILRYAVPALMSMAGGAGIFPGLAAGMAGSAKGRQKEMEATTDWNKAKSAEELRREQLAAAQAQRDITNKRADKQLGLSAARISDEQKALRIGQQYQSDPTKVSANDINWYKSYMRLKKTSNMPPPNDPDNEFNR